MTAEVGFWSIAKTDPTRLAVVEPDGTLVTAEELHSQANQLVRGLRALGFERGDCIATALVNGAPMLAVFLAAHQAGWYVTPINWHLTAAEMAYILEDCEAKAVVASARVADAIAEAADSANLPADARFSVSGEIRGFHDLSTLTEGHATEAPDGRSAGATMTYTSGTTGNPKGVRRPLFDVPPETVAMQQAMFLSLFGIMPGSPGVHLVGAPLYHTAVLNFATNHLHLGHTLVLMDKWDPKETLELIERHKVTSSHMVPTQFTRLLKLPEDTRKAYDLSSLSHIIHSAAPCPVKVKHEMLEWWGPCIYEYYAASEGGGTLVRPEEWLTKPGTVGKAWPISELRILDDDHQPLPPGEAGTVWMRMGDHKFEYHRDKAKTGDAWREGFFTVGDAGYLDEDGYLFLCDRKADMIISGGVNIYPAEIEAVLVSHPRVLDVAVFGVPDDDWGESVKAVVQPIPDVTGDGALEADIIEYAASKLAKYKMPRSIDFTDALPRDPNGKLYKRKLRDPYWEGRSRAI